MVIVKSIANKAMYSVQKLHLCLFSSSTKVILASFSSSKFPVYSSLIYQLIFSYTYNVHSVNTHKYHMI